MIITRAHRWTSDESDAFRRTYDVLYDVILTCERESKRDAPLGRHWGYDTKAGTFSEKIVERVSQILYTGEDDE